MLITSDQYFVDVSTIVFADKQISKIAVLKMSVMAHFYAESRWVINGAISCSAQTVYSGPDKPGSEISFGKFFLSIKIQLKKS